MSILRPLWVRKYIICLTAIAGGRASDRGRLKLVRADSSLAEV